MFPSHRQQVALQDTRYCHLMYPSVGRTYLKSQALVDEKSVLV